MAYRDVDALLARVARLEDERLRVRARARRIARGRRQRVIRRRDVGLAALVVGVGGVATIFLLRRQPELTEARVVDDLGRDELVLRFWTVADEPTKSMPCEAKPGLVSINDERDAAIAAGWLERVCPGDPERVRLTEEGRRRSSGWQRYDPSDHQLTSWTVTVARYERSGAPILPPTSSVDEDSRLPQRLVTIPGRYLPNEDGKRLYDTGWQKIRVVDRVDKFLLWRGIWARNHGD
jgi:hypothetical protein